MVLTHRYVTSACLLGIRFPTAVCGSRLPSRPREHAPPLSGPSQARDCSASTRPPSCRACPARLHLTRDPGNRAARLDDELHRLSLELRRELPSMPGYSPILSSGENPPKNPDTSHLLSAMGASRFCFNTNTAFHIGGLCHNSWVSLQSLAPSASKVLVVGGAGYIGSVLVGRLLYAGHDVRVFDRLIWDNGSALQYVADHPRFEFQFGDMRDRRAVDRALDDVVSVILLAGLVGDPITRKYPLQSASINLNGVQTVVTAAIERRTARLVFASTCSNYGLHDGDELVDERSPVSPLSLYAEQKITIEESLMERREGSDTSMTILRFATAFGLSPRMRLDLTVAHFAKDAVNDGAIEIYDADTWRPYCHVSDLSEAVRTVLESDRGLINGEVFNVGSSEQNFTKRMLGEMITKFRPEVQLIFREGGGDARNYRVSFEKIRNTLGFEAKVGVENHLTRLLSALEQGVISLDQDSLKRMGNHDLSGGAVRLSKDLGK